MRVANGGLPWLQQKTGGGVHFNATCKLTKIDEKMVRMILNEYSMLALRFRAGAND